MRDRNFEGEQPYRRDLGGRVIREHAADQRFVKGSGTDAGLTDDTALDEHIFIRRSGGHEKWCSVFQRHP